MEYCEYTQSFGRKFAKSTRRLSEELAASKRTLHRQIKTLEKNHAKAVDLYLMNRHQNRLNVDICRQVIGNPMDDRFIRRILPHVMKN